MASGKREHWSGSFGFIMAAAGSAIGLGNVWKFPYITGMNGGGAFVLVYLGAILFIGLPVMLAELAIGRASQSDAIGAFRHFSTKSAVMPKLIAGYALGLATALAYVGSYGLAAVIGLLGILFYRFGWVVAGFFSSLVAVLILSYYAVIGGWIFGYAGKAFAGQLHFTDSATAAESFVGMARNFGLSAALMIAFMLACSVICWLGVKRGLEVASRYMMPLLFVLILVLVARGLTLPGAARGIEFFLKPDFGKLSAHGVLEALGHAFFSLSLGMGSMITYGGYLRRDRNIFSAALWISGLDTLIAILAGLAIFPAVFAMGFNPGAGPGLIFNILPAAFNAIPGGLGWLWSGIFFILMLIAALTSGMSILEVGVASAMEHLKMSRHRAVIAVGSGVTLLGLLVAASTIGWSNIPALETLWLTCFGSVKASFLDQLDYICSSWMLPLNGLAAALFVGWIWGTRKAARELYRRAVPTLPSRPETGFRRLLNLRLPITFWGFFIRFIAPILVFITFLYAAGFFKFN
jgi:NSS family neurotransmitter:Na+ symporter